MKTLDTRIKDNLRRRLSKTLKDTPRHKKAHELLGCGLKHFKKHLESSFTEGMSWDNYGFGDDKWNIDHIIPLISAANEAELFKLCHFSNLQPLWQINNLRKGAKI